VLKTFLLFQAISRKVLLNKKLGEEGKTTIDFKVSNILGDRIESFYRSYEAEKQVFSSLNPGRAFSIGLSHKF
jgi:hypothetical protein